MTFFICYSTFLNTLNFIFQLSYYKIDESLTPTKDGGKCLRKISMVGGRFLHLSSISLLSFCLK